MVEQVDLSWMDVASVQGSRIQSAMGNEYHSIVCERIDGPRPQLTRDPRDAKGKMFGLLLQLCSNIKSKGNVVILDSGFCVLQGLVELKKCGIYASAAIKKQWYWPKYVPGELMMDAQHMAPKAIGDTEALSGDMEGVRYHLFVMKDVAYTTMKIMATYGTCDRVGKLNYRPQHPTFQYTEPYHNHYK
jgi:Transposase IS4